MKKSKSNSIFLPLAIVGGLLLFSKKKKDATPAQAGIGRASSVESVVRAAWTNKQTGKEKICNDSLHWGVGAEPYAYVKDLKKSGINYKVAPGQSKQTSYFGYFHTKQDLQQFVEWLYKEDGYLEVS